LLSNGDGLSWMNGNSLPTLSSRPVEKDYQYFAMDLKATLIIAEKLHISGAELKLVLGIKSHEFL
jgi:hypothetical protein